MNSSVRRWGIMGTTISGASWPPQLYFLVKVKAKSISRVMLWYLVELTRLLSEAAPLGRGRSIAQSSTVSPGRLMNNAG